MGVNVCVVPKSVQPEAPTCSLCDYVIINYQLLIRFLNSLQTCLEGEPI